MARNFQSFASPGDRLQAPSLAIVTKLTRAGGFRGILIDEGSIAGRDKLTEQYCTSNLIAYSESGIIKDLPLSTITKHG